MAISLGDAKGLQSEMNVVPLIDILLVLIIIFMVISPLTPQGLEAEAPQPDPTRVRPSEPAPEIVVITITKSGKLSINREAIEWDNLGDRLVDIFKSRATRVAFVWGEPDVEFREVARAIDIMRSAGVDRVGLLPGEFGQAVH